jgi:carboxyl-terminal processing protease
MMPAIMIRNGEGARVTRMAITFLLAILLIHPFGAAAAAPADLAVAEEVLANLETRHWNPHLDIPAIISAGVDGLRRALQQAGIDASVLKQIPPSLDKPSALKAFGDRLDQAVVLAKGRIPGNTLLYAGLRAMLKSVGGSHTSFLTPTQLVVAQAILEGKTYGGIGIGFVKSNEHWILGSIVPGGPADRAGVRRGDRVIRIDDVDVDGLDTPEVQALFLGAPGTIVRLTILRGTVEFTVVIVRGEVQVPVADSRTLPGGIGYLKLYRYSRGSTQIVRKELTQLLAARPLGLIVDLRENGGGLISEYVETMGLFLPTGSVVYQEIGRDGVPRLGRTTGTAIVPAIPLVALIDIGAASNGELTAAALKEHGNATLVGEHTAGQLEYASLLSLSDGSGMNIAFARVLTSKNVELEGRGYPPDVVVPLDPEGTRDLQLERALQLLIRRLSRSPSEAVHKIIAVPPPRHASQRRPGRLRLAGRVHVSPHARLRPPSAA